ASPTKAERSSRNLTSSARATTAPRPASVYCCLEMLDGVVVQTETRQQYTDAGLGAVVARAELVKLRDDLSAFVGLAQFQISFGQQVEVLRLVRMFLDLLRQLGQIQLRPVLRREIGTIIKIIEKMLIGIRT